MTKKKLAQLDGKTTGDAFSYSQYMNMNMNIPKRKWLKIARKYRKI